MSGRILNLSRVRKTRARAEKAARGDANAARFGRTKADRAKTLAETEKTDRDLDMRKLDRSDGGCGP